MSDDTEPPEGPDDDGPDDDEEAIIPEGAVAQASIEPIEIQEEMERSFLDYAMSVITARALPDARLMKQVTLEDAAQADEIFSILMGEDVEQRRSFIQRNAKDVRFLDI